MYYPTFKVPCFKWKLTLKVFLLTTGIWLRNRWKILGKKKARHLPDFFINVEVRLS